MQEQLWMHVQACSMPVLSTKSMWQSAEKGALGWQMCMYETWISQ